MKFKDKIDVEVKGKTLSSNIMGKNNKKSKKDKLNAGAVKNIDFSQVTYDENQLEDFMLKQKKMKENKMHMSDSESDDSDITVRGNDEDMNWNIENENTKNKMADKGGNSSKSVSDSSKMADNELYKHTDKGPYYVIGEHKDIDEFELCELFMQFKMKDIANVNKITKDKVRILTKSYTAANSIIKLGNFSALKKYKLFIPNNFVFTDGIVRDIPLHYEEDHLMDIIKCKVPIVSITRLNFWNREAQVSQPSKSLKITFRSAVVPDNISFMWLLRKVDIFVPKPLFCQLCLKYGHFKKYCNPTNNPPLCRVCAKPAHNSDATCSPNCKQCKDTHLTADRNCPAFKYQSDIKRVMAIKKVTYNEAKEIKAKENPTPAASNNSYRKMYADIVASAPVGSPGTNSSSSANIQPDNSKEKAFIITISKIVESITNKNSPGNNDELLISIIKEVRDFWKANALPPSQPSTSNGAN